MSLSVHIDKRYLIKVKVKVSGKGPTEWLDDTMLTVETQDSNKFTKPNINVFKLDL